MCEYENIWYYKVFIKSEDSSLLSNVLYNIAYAVTFILLIFVYITKMYIA